MKKRLCLVLAALMLCAFAATPCAHAKVGDVVGKALHTDIVAYINHYALPSYAVNGQSCIIAEDLRNFGFDVVWNGNSRSLTISRNSATEVSEMFVAKEGIPNTFFAKTLETDISVYANSNKITSYAINGCTMIPIEELWMFGEVSWVDWERSIKLWVDDLSVRPSKQEVKEDLTFFSNGLMAVVTFDNANLKWGYVNTKGEVVIPFIYDDAWDFAENGLARVITNGKWGYINEKGKQVIPCIYDYIDYFAENGLAAVEMNGKYGYINEKGEQVIPFIYDGASDFAENGLAAVKMYGKWGYINEKGEVVVPCIYDRVEDFAENGLAIVGVGKDIFNAKWGFINEKGEQVIPCIYDSVSESGFAANGLAAVEKNGKWGYINEKGEVVIPFIYDYSGGFAENGLAAVEKDGKCGYINEKGEMVVPAIYDWAGSFAENGLAAVEKDGKRGYINEKGEQVVPFIYNYISGFAENGLAKVTKNGKFGCINEKGEEVIPAIYDYMTGYHLLERNNYIIAIRNGNGKKVSVPIGNHIAFEEPRVITLGGEICIYNKKGEKLVSLGENMIPLECGNEGFLFLNNGNIGLADYEGNVIFSYISRYPNTEWCSSPDWRWGE